MKGFALSDKVKRWDVLVKNAAQTVEEAPHMPGALETLGRQLAEAWLLIGRAEALKAEAQENTKKLLTLVKEGEKVPGPPGIQSPGAVRAGQRGAGPLRVPPAPSGTPQAE